MEQQEYRSIYCYVSSKPRKVRDSVFIWSSILMRVLFCKIQCPFICFCKPSSHIYTPGPLRLENTPPTPVQTQTLRISEDDAEAEAAAGDKDNRPHKQRVIVHETDDGYLIANHHQNSGSLQSCLRKSPLKSEPGTASAQKKKVQWLDFFGKELAQIREFKSSEAEDMDYEGVKGRGCICSIL
ncbi:uncharacterized protein LOC104889833 [Beta vulgaris subsp. vulgaris]|uniref:uncharacterized protein LOC104889833 n=1 Tax=Beta vulgaris subsp. vulgaris TaxID=3555 RepID=UPI0020366D61|nr:uncharacterized protein LOC104889833 [Beta vulgaris subsp. vulgaris]